MSNPLEQDTESLLVQAGSGDVAAWSQLLERHRDRLRLMVKVRLERQLWSRLDPSDIVQEALAEASQKLSAYLILRPVAFYPWLRRLAWEHLVRLREVHVTAQRRSVLRESYALSELTDDSAMQLVDHLASGAAPDQQLLHSEMKSRLLATLTLLNQRDREILVLRYLEQLSVAEIAATLGCTEGSVRTRHTRALARLVKHIDRDLGE